MRSDTPAGSWIARALLACLVAFPVAATAQMPFKGGARGPTTGQPVLTPAQSARLAELDALQTAIVKKDADALRRLIARGDKLDINFDEAYRGRTSESPLTMAINRGHLEIAQILLEAGADPNRPDGFGTLPIRRAGSPEAVALLRRYGAVVPPDQVAPTGAAATQAIWTLISSGDDAGAAKLLIERGGDPSALVGRQTLLEQALFRGRWRIARQLADAGAKLQPPDGAECVQAMRECHSIEAARLATLDPPTLAHLKARGLDLERVASSGFTALNSLLVEPPPMRVQAIRPDGTRGAVLEPPTLAPRIRALLQNGADPNRRFREYTPLMVAVAVPQKPPEVADALVEFGGRAEVDFTIATTSPDKPAAAYALPATPTTAIAILGEPPVRDTNGLLRGRTVGPLTWLVLHRRADLAARILERERKLAAPDRFLPYFGAVLGQWDLVIKALAYTREPDVADRAGVTPLMFAAEDGRADAVKALIAAGANVNARSDRDWPPLWETPPGMWFMGHPPTRPRLVGGYTPLKIARERGRDEVVRILLQAGARE